MHEPLLNPDERAAMKRYFLAARQWDKHRRDMLRREPNDPAVNRLSYNRLMQTVHRAHAGLLIDDQKEDEAESKLARALSRR